MSKIKYTFYNHILQRHSDQRIPALIYMSAFLWIRNFSLLLFFLIIVPSLFRFSHFSSLSLSTSSLNWPPFHLQLWSCVLCVSLKPCSWQLSWLQIIAVPRFSQKWNTVTQTHPCKHTSPLSYIWEIKSIHDKLELCIKSNTWIIYVYNRLHYMHICVFIHADTVHTYTNKDFFHMHTPNINTLLDQLWKRSINKG